VFGESCNFQAFLGICKPKLPKSNAICNKE